MVVLLKNLPAWYAPPARPANEDCAPRHADCAYLSHGFSPSLSGDSSSFVYIAHTLRRKIPSLQALA
uniref:hypothetical protein n=1 Tax=Acinetobacter baumannii TaxID=470 RepID=UPI001BB465FE